MWLIIDMLKNLDTSSSTEDLSSHQVEEMRSMQIAGLIREKIKLVLL